MGNTNSLQERLVQKKCQSKKVVKSWHHVDVIFLFRGHTPIVYSIAILASNLRRHLPYLELNLTYRRPPQTQRVGIKQPGIQSIRSALGSALKLRPFTMSLPRTQERQGHRRREALATKYTSRPPTRRLFQFISQSATNGGLIRYFAKAYYCSRAEAMPNASLAPNKKYAPK